MKLRLVDIAGEFCTHRTAPELPRLIEILTSSILKNEEVDIDLTGVKILTPSFVDELVPPLAIKFGTEKVQNLIRFHPKLEGFLKEQIERGTRARLGSAGRN